MKEQWQQNIEEEEEHKLTPPTSVTQLGTYIRAINVFFDQNTETMCSVLGHLHPCKSWM
jgi:hypothetical protein